MKQLDLLHSVSSRRALCVALSLFDTSPQAAPSFVFGKKCFVDILIYHIGYISFVMLLS